MDKSLVVGETSMKKLRFQTPAKLNDDLMGEVINRLPAISNFRFKCVSKQWFILNSEALRRKSQTLTILGMFYVTGSWDKTEVSMRYTGTQKGRGKEDSSIDKTLSFLPKHFNMTIRCSCNGLLLCEGWSEKYPVSDQTLYLCNPATRKWVEIPYDYPTNVAVILLDFNPLDSIHFSVITISSCRRGYIFALFSSKTEEWKVCQVVNKIPRIYSFVDDTTLFFGGLIFCLNWGGTDVMGFDMEGNSCRRIELPGKSHRKTSFLLSRTGRSGGCLGQSGGFLHYYYKSETKVYVWKLVDYESGLWSLKVNFCVTGQFLDLKLHPEVDDILVLRLGYKILSYNIKTTQIIELCSFPCITPGYFPYSPCYLEGFGPFGKHVETK